MSEQPKQPKPPEQPEQPQNDDAKHAVQVSFLGVYFLAVLAFAFWLLLDVWSKNFVFMRRLGVPAQMLVIVEGSSEASESHMLRAIGFAVVGGIMGSVLYQIRVLYRFYAQEKRYDSRWFGKYITGPWEGAGMALVVLALIRGGVAVFGGSTGIDVSNSGNFATFGVGALVGFGLRDVVEWVERLVQTMFTISDKDKPEDEPGEQEITIPTQTTDPGKPEAKNSDGQKPANRL